MCFLLFSDDKREKKTIPPNLSLSNADVAGQATPKEARGSNNSTQGKAAPLPLLPSPLAGVVFALVRL